MMSANNAKELSVAQESWTTATANYVSSRAEAQSVLATAAAHKTYATGIPDIEETLATLDTAVSKLEAALESSTPNPDTNNTSQLNDAVTAIRKATADIDIAMTPVNTAGSIIAEIVVWSVSETAKTG